MHRLVIAACLTVMVGCASIPAPDRTELNSRARATFPGSVADVFWVPPMSSAFSEAGRISRLTVDSGAAHPGLVKLLRTANQTQVRLLVSGASSSLARHELVAALAQAQGPLSQLELAFIGEEADAASVRAAVEKSGGRYVAAQ